MPDDSHAAPDPHSGAAVRLIASLPVLVPVLVALLAVTCTTLLLLESYSGPLALAIATVLSIPVVRYLGLGEHRLTRRELLVDVLALFLALGFAGVNAKFASQNINVGRDPGVYSVASQWLSNHGSVDVDTETRVFGTTRGLQSGSAGIGLRPERDRVYFQGSHGLPAVLAVVGSVVGPRVMYGANAVLGGLALLAVYGFGRLVIGRWGALVAAGLLGVSLPQIAFSRDAFTEPISQLLLFGGLTLLLLAQRGRSLSWLLAGLVVAGGCLTRIDSFLVIPGIMGYVGLVLATAPRAERRVVGRDMAALVAGLSVSAVLGYLDLKLFSAGYLHSLRAEFGMISLLIGGSVLGVALLVLIGWLTPVVGWLGQLRTVTHNRIAAVAAVGVVLMGAVLAVRPWLYTAHGIDDPGKQKLIESMQLREQQTVDNTRTFAESTLTWMSWYLGPVLVTLGILGLALLLARTLRKGDLRMVPFLLVFVVTGLLYLVKPSITPDQIWAMRRFVPIVLPGLALAAMLVVIETGAFLRDKRPELSVGAGLLALCALLWPALRPVSAARLGAVAVAIVVVGLVLLAVRRSRAVLALAVSTLMVVALLVPVARTTRPLAFEAQGRGQLAEVQKVCRVLPANAAVFLLGSMSRTYPMTLRAFCDVPATWVNGGIPPGAKELIAIRTALQQSGRDLYLMGQIDIRDTVTTDVPLQRMNTLKLQTWVESVSHPPNQIRPFTRDLFLGQVGPEGSVVRWLTR